MFGCVNVTINANGIPYLRTTNISVSGDAVDFGLGIRRIQPVGLMAINIANAIPEGTTTTLPVRLTLNGVTRNLTFFGGTNVTAEDLQGTGAILVMYDWYNGILQLLSVVPSSTTVTADSGE